MSYILSNLSWYRVKSFDRWSSALSKKPLRQMRKTTTLSGRMLQSACNCHCHLSVTRNPGTKMGTLNSIGLMTIPLYMSHIWVRTRVSLVSKSALERDICSFPTTQKNKQTKDRFALHYVLMSFICHPFLQGSATFSSNIQHINQRPIILKRSSSSHLPHTPGDLDSSGKTPFNMQPKEDSFVFG